MIDAAAFDQALLFMFSDVEREIQLANADPTSLTELGVTPGGGNFLAALGLLCYTEFGGKLKFNRKKASANFNEFFDCLGIAYADFRITHDVYDDLRCGLAHEYYVKKTCIVSMFGAPQQPGIGFDVNTGCYWFAVDRYAQDMKVAFQALRADLFAGSS